MHKNTNSALIESSDNIKELLAHILKQSTQQGATNAAASLSFDEGFAVDVRMKEVETISFGDERALSITLYYKNARGSAHGTDISKKGIDNLISKALEIAKLTSQDPCFGLADKKLLTNEFKSLHLSHPWDLTPEKAIELAQRCEAAALDSDSLIVNSDGVNISTANSSFGYANTHGAMAVTNSSIHSMSGSFIAAKDNKMQRDYDFTAARNPLDLKNFDSLALSAAQKAIARLDAKKIPTGSYPIIFTPRVACSIFNSFISAITGQNLYKKNSFLINSLQEQVFPNFINIFEKPHLTKALGSAAFDTEGVPTRENKFVIDGIVNSYVLGSYAARKLGMETTANSDGVHNLFVSNTHKDLDALKKLVPKALLVTDLMGQGVNILTGDYSRGVSGFLLEAGEIVHPVEGVTIAGNLKNMFKDIKAVGLDYHHGFATHCGSLLIDKMMVAGH